MTLIYEKKMQKRKSNYPGPTEVIDHLTLGKAKSTKIAGYIEKLRGRKDSSRPENS